MRVFGITSLTLVAILAVQMPARGGDGRFEINQSCAAVGCFSGDTAGFPVQITTNGSYVLTSDLAVGNNGSAVTVSGSASLDLNGFRVSGISPFGVGGISISGVDVEVKNGLLSGFGAGLTGSNAHRLSLLNLRITSSANLAGIDLGMTSNAQIRDCVVSGSQQGILAGGDGVQVIGNRVVGSTTGDGIRVGSRALVADNIVSGNAGDGIEVSASSQLRGNVVTGSGLLGINLNATTLVIGNTAIDNMLGNIESTCASCLLVDNLAP